jgi:hypothetical protein
VNCYLQRISKHRLYAYLSSVVGTPRIDRKQQSRHHRQNLGPVMEPLSLAGKNTSGDRGLKILTGSACSRSATTPLVHMKAI